MKQVPIQATPKMLAAGIGALEDHADIRLPDADGHDAAIMEAVYVAMTEAAPSGAQPTVSNEGGAAPLLTALEARLSKLRREAIEPEVNLEAVAARNLAGDAIDALRTVVVPGSTGAGAVEGLERRLLEFQSLISQSVSGMWAPRAIHILYSFAAECIAALRAASPAAKEDDRP